MLGAWNLLCGSGPHKYHLTHYLLSVCVWLCVCVCVAVTVTVSVSVYVFFHLPHFFLSKATAFVKLPCWCLQTLTDLNVSKRSH